MTPLTATLLLSPTELRKRLPSAYSALTRHSSILSVRCVDRLGRWWKATRTIINGSFAYALQRE